MVDDQPGKIHDGRFDENPTPSWGRKPAPGTAQIYVFPNARDGRVIADVVRLDKGHTEGLEPLITEELIKLVVSAPGGKLRGVQVVTDSETRPVTVGAQSCFHCRTHSVQNDGSGYINIGA